MTTRTWEIEGEDGRHTVEYEAGWGGRRVVRLDGREVVREGRPMSPFGAYDLPVPGRAVMVAWWGDGHGTRHDLIVDGRGLDTGKAWQMPSSRRKQVTAGGLAVVAAALVLPAARADFDDDSGIWPWLGLSVAASLFVIVVRGTGPRVGPVLSMAMAVAPSLPLAVFAVWIWGGLNRADPPNFAPLIVLVVFGAMYGGWYLFVGIREVQRRGWWGAIVTAGFMVGVLLAVLAVFTRW